MGDPRRKPIARGVSHSRDRAQGALLRRRFGCSQEPTVWAMRAGNRVCDDVRMGAIAHRVRSCDMDVRC